MAKKIKAIDPIGIKNVNFTIGEETDKRAEDWKHQRLTRGFDDTELWSLDSTIAKFIAPRLRAFKEHAERVGDHPGRISSAEWQEILEAILKGFEIYPDHFNWASDVSEENWNTVHKAMSLFQKWFFDLWN